MADQLSRVFAALADPTRRDMVARLTEADHTVNDLAAGVHTRVGAPGDGDPHRREPEGSGQGVLEGRLHGPQTWLCRPPGEVGAVVGTVDPQAHAAILGVERPHPGSGVARPVHYLG